MELRQCYLHGREPELSLVRCFVDGERVATRGMRNSEGKKHWAPEGETRILCKCGNTESCLYSRQIATQTEVGRAEAGKRTVGAEVHKETRRKLRQRELTTDIFCEA